MTAALIGFAAIFLLALMRVPLAFAMGLVGFAGRAPGPCEPLALGAAALG